MKRRERQDSENRLGGHFAPSLGRFSRHIIEKLRENEQSYRLLKRIYRFIRRPKKTFLEMLFGYRRLSSVNVPTIYCCIDGVFDIPFMDGTRRVGKYFSHHLTTSDIPDFRVVLVKWTGKTFVEANPPKGAVVRFFARKTEWNPNQSDFLLLQTIESVNRIGQHDLNLLRSKVKIAIFVHDLLPLLRPDWFTERMISGFAYSIELVLNEAHLVLVTSRVVERDLRELISARKVQSSTPSIELVNIASTASSFTGLERTERRKVPKSQCQFLLISTVEPRKGYDELIEAATRALINGANISFTIIGRLGWISDTFQAQFEHFVETFEDRVHWYRNASDAQVKSLMKEADFFLSPTRGEGFGLPVAEALSAGLPTIARDIPIYRELYESYVVFFGERGDSRDLQSVLENLDDLYEIAQTRLLKYSPPTELKSLQDLLSALRSN